MALFGVASTGRCDDVRVFQNPTIVGSDGQTYRLDHCLHWEVLCGCEAALEFCRREGFPFVARYATDFRLDLKHIPTAIIADAGVLCPGRVPGHRCDSFTEIVCARQLSLGSPGCIPVQSLATPGAPLAARPGRRKGGRKGARPQFEAAPSSESVRTNAPAPTPQSGDGGADEVSFSATAASGATAAAPPPAVTPPLLIGTPPLGAADEAPSPRK